MQDELDFVREYIELMRIRLPRLYYGIQQLCSGRFQGQCLGLSAQTHFLSGFPGVGVQGPEMVRNGWKRCRLGIRRFSFRQDGLPAAPYRTGRYPVCRGVEGLCTDMASGMFGAGSDADEHEGSGRAASIIQPSKMSYVERGRVVFGKVRIPVSDTYRQGLHDFLGRHSVFL